MSDLGINFSWAYIGAVVLGALIAFVVGEVVERGLRDVWGILEYTFVHSEI